MAQRKELFSKFDINNNGLLSLAEIDKAVKDVIGCAALFNSKPAVMRASRRPAAPMAAAPA